MTTTQLKQKYLKFFSQRGHAIIPSASLIPENDPTALFTSAGMHPLVPYLMGEKHPQGRRLADVQKCVRTSDIDEVGDAWHLTFFEMAGNWSLGDYFKEDAIKWSWEFLTSKIWLGINPERLYISAFAGDSDAPKDAESAKIWQSVGVKKDHIFYYGKAENWWGPAGETGPCGPDTEMYYDTGKPACKNCKKIGPACNCGKYAEIWNDVFMQYNKTSAGKYEPLAQKNVDTGMGVERTAAILQGKDNVYAVETFQPIISKITELANVGSQTSHINEKSIRVITDHLRAATFILGDEQGIVPSNVDQGYILRRLIRKAIRHGKLLGINQQFTHEIAEIVIKQYQADYPELQKNKNFIIEQLVAEEEKFTKTLSRGLKEFEKLSTKNISGHDAFILFSSYGFPLEITKELAQEQGITVDEAGFQVEFKKHQDLSRAGGAKRFKGGLADASIETAKLHTATHLLLAALRQVLGDHVYQRGSNITPERLRLDFSHPEKLTPEQLEKMENIVNKQIKKDLPVAVEEMSVKQAKAKGAMGIFEQKYGDVVKVYSVGDFSQEICGGPHAKTTGELGHFKIQKEEASSAGVRRIRAVLK